MYFVVLLTIVMNLCTPLTVDPDGVKKWGIWPASYGCAAHAASHFLPHDAL